MADCYTRFSCTLNVGSQQNVTEALRMYKNINWANVDELKDPEDTLDVDDFRDVGFKADAVEMRPGLLWLHDTDGSGSPAKLCDFVFACAERFNLTGRWGFRWAFTCSSPREDGFGGGATALDLGLRRKLGYIDCYDWLDDWLSDVSAKDDVADNRCYGAAATMAALAHLAPPASRCGCALGTQRELLGLSVQG